ncbi:biosynthetic-type acetolactate synthase large subunit [archaeon]|nr:MAG: biosynthetic-type acetolactate synthase large subunit [archaeon]
MKGTEIVVESLKRHKVDVMFGLPGGAIMPVYDVLYDTPEIKHILGRHEQGVAHMADGYARASGKPGVLMVTSGPGATNTITGIATAYMDSSPLVSFAGQVPTHLIGKDAFQETDVFSLMIPITKMNFLPKRTEELPATIKLAFEIATKGRPGPVHIDLPRDVQLGEVGSVFYPTEDLYHYSIPEPSSERIRQAAEMLLSAQYPIILAGGGVILSGASTELAALAEFLWAPIVTTLMGKGCIPADHPLYLGHVGMHGLRSANHAIQEADLILAVGTRFSDRTTGKVSEFAPKARIIHVEIDESEIGKIIKPQLALLGDAKRILSRLLKTLQKLSKKGRKNAWSERMKQLKQLDSFDIDWDATPIRPERVVKEISDLLRKDDIVTTEVGQCQMFATLHIRTYKPRHFITSGGLGTMGFGLPAAIGAKAASPDSVVVDVAGDGSYIMTCNSLPVSIEHHLPIVVAILDNRYLGMVRQWQELFMDKKYSHVYLGERTDLTTVAEGFGAKGIVVTKPTEIREALQEAFKSDTSTVIDFMVEREANVFPMVPAGAALTEFVEVRKTRGE